MVFSSLLKISRPFDRSAMGVAGIGVVFVSIAALADGRTLDGAGLSENVTVFGSAHRFDGESFDFATELSVILDFVLTFSLESFRS